MKRLISILLCLCLTAAALPFSTALAARLPGSRNLFERRFREAIGHSVLAEILRIRLEKAQMLLLRPEIPIGAIAAFSGFASERALHDVFKSRFGKCMRDWRRDHLL